MFKPSRQRILIGLIFVLGTSVLALGVVLLTPTPAPAEPTISWMPISS